MKKTILWLFTNSEVFATTDKFKLFLVKFTYLSLRVILRLVLGKKRRDTISQKHGIDFETLWSKFFNFKRMNKDSHLSKFKMPKYNLEFYCRNNKDDFKVMTHHEDVILQRFKPNEGDVVVDVGAHIGLYTIIASKHAKEQGKIVSIEADPDNFEVLSRNISLNGLSNVIALNCAAYSKKEKVKLYLSGKEKGFTKYNTLMSGRSGSQFVEVEANTVDYLLQSNGIKQEGVNWIKIDVEGAEYEVLKGSTNILSQSKDISLLVEIHNLGNGENMYDTIVHFLNDYNFRNDFEKTYESGEKHVIFRKD